MTKRAVVIGGFATSRRALEPVADAMGDVFGDAEIIAFRKAMDNPGEVRRKVEGQVVITHSAGVMAVGKDMNPERIFACNGPIPSRLGSLVMSSIIKTLHHYRDSLRDPDWEAYVRVMNGNTAELMFRPYGNLRHVGAIGRFSTYSHLFDAQSGAGIQVGAAATVGDEFFRYEPALNPYGVPVASNMNGGHDEFLIRPKPFVAALELQMS